MCLLLGRPLGCFHSCVLFEVGRSSLCVLSEDGHWDCSSSCVLFKGGYWSAPLHESFFKRVAGATPLNVFFLRRITVVLPFMYHFQEGSLGSLLFMCLV